MNKIERNDDSKPDSGQKKNGDDIRLMVRVIKPAIVIRTPKSILKNYKNPIIKIMNYIQNRRIVHNILPSNLLL